MKVGDKVFIDGYSSFCDPHYDTITDIIIRHDEKTGIKYNVIVCGTQKYRSDNGECIEGAKAYFLKT